MTADAEGASGAVMNSAEVEEHVFNVEVVRGTMCFYALDNKQDFLTLRSQKE